jgi:mannitol/fructose-specific phosphotransferase system IIA component
MNDILKKENIVLNQPAEDREKIILRCGQMLLDSGYINERYIEGMIRRDNSMSTAIGNYIAIPHGAENYKQDIIRTGMVVLTCPEGIDWHGSTVYLVIGIAAKSDEHIDIIGNIVEYLETPEDTISLVKNADVEEVFNLLTTKPI